MLSRLAQADGRHWGCATTSTAHSRVACDTSRLRASLEDSYTRSLDYQEPSAGAAVSASPIAVLHASDNPPWRPDRGRRALRRIRTRSSRSFALSRRKGGLDFLRVEDSSAEGVEFGRDIRSA
jgi:hypothetical protein